MIEQREFIRHLRGNPTDAERKLWRYLRMRQMNGYKFRRQHAVGEYIVDFAYVERKLAVELDGSQHAEKTGYDANRTKFLEAHGYCVLRFWNNEVFGNLNGILTVILAALAEPCTPIPTFPLEGGRRIELDHLKT